VRDKGQPGPIAMHNNAACVGAGRQAHVRNARKEARNYEAITSALHVAMCQCARVDTATARASSHATVWCTRCGRQPNYPCMLPSMGKVHCTQHPSVLIIQAQRDPRGMSRSDNTPGDAHDNAIKGSSDGPPERPPPPTPEPDNPPCFAVEEGRVRVQAPHDSLDSRYRRRPERQSVR